jgi:hypothetical protein
MHRLAIYLFLLLFLSSARAADEWHGIKPGSSTRVDVIREFGECLASASYCEFNLPTEDVFITFSGPKSCPDVG